ncbi:MAG: HAMP domain-containing histidine kinase [Deltaproteobacteria bacterium]|nr:HAMP domain-containing histidine kinase [Deltaproteobacteria bacterium]
MRARLLLALALVALAVGAAVALATGVGAGRDAKARLEVEALVLGRHLARIVAPTMNDPDPAARAAVLAELGADLQVDLAVFDPSGRPLGSFGDSVLPPDPTELALVLSGQVRFVREPWPARVAAPLEWNGRRLGLVVGQLARMPGPPSTSAGLLLGAGLLVLGLVAGVLVAFRAVAPIGRLNESLDLAADGDLAQRALAIGPTEVRRLAERMNMVMDRLTSAATGDRELLAIAGGELRSALSRVREDVAALADGANNFNRIEAELIELDALIEDLLTTSRLGLDTLAIRCRRTRLGVLVREAAASVAAHNPLSFDVDPQLPEVDVDARLFQKVVKILVINAAQSCDPGTAIGVRVDHDGHFIRVTVADGGGGIEPRELERIFEPFVRGKAAKKRVEGSGLGLTLARRIVEAHRGTIGATSEVGVGTSVTFTVPITTP